MAVEQIRACGWRKVGGLYLCGEGPVMSCDQLPYELSVCPVCGAGIKFSRGFQWIDWIHLDGEHMDNPNCRCPEACPICNPGRYSQPYGLLWCGEVFYTPESFIQEAIQMGVSKRLAVTAVPKKLKLGETWVLFAHKKAIKRFIPREQIGGNIGIDEPDELPAVFYAFRPQVLELLIWESEATEDKLVELEHRGIKPIIIPDGDIDHDPNTKLKMTEAEKTQVKFARSMQEIRESLRK